MARRYRRIRRKHRKDRNRLFTQQLIEYLTSEKKRQDQEKISVISDRLGKVSVSETNKTNVENDHQEVQNILRDFTI